MKTIIGLAIGIVLAAAVIIPLANRGTEAKLEAQKNQIALEQTQAELEAMKMAAQTQIPSETTKPQEIKEVSAETPETTELGETFAPEETAEIKAEPTPQPISSPQVKETPKQSVSAYPKYFYENGQKYAYYDEFHEREGMKTLIADESEPNATSGETYDWLTDPLKDVPGPFNGNGGN
ncbi:MAG: hypothetical protein LBD85_06490 [Oscillospiraceae bacterium]|jgi:type II secretory pathway pseudopilin PulG|nr:hypothetical protein [Oscillospiraceae bacterium]